MVDLIHRLKATKGRTITVFWAGDKQRGSDAHYSEAWEVFKEEFKATPDAYFVGLGDYDDWLRPSMRDALNAPLARDESARKMLDTMVRKGHDETIREMEFLKGRVLGLHEGHHTWKFASGELTDQRLAAALGAPFLGWTATMRLELERPGCKRRSHLRYVYTTVSQHGNANGRLVPSALSWAERNIATAFIADQYVMGHGCKNASMVPQQRQFVRRNGPAGREIKIPRIMVVGGFAKAYTNGWDSGYVERAGMAPQPVGWGKLTFSWSTGAALCKAKGVKPGTWVLDVQQENRTPEI